jgi:hypothetical protein
VEEEVSKEKFKELYFTYATANSGWTKEYWNLFYESKEGIQFFFSKPDSPQQTRMFVITEGSKHRMIFLTEESEESFFD